MRVEDLDFHLPSELIATRPAEPRDSARLLVISRTDPARIEHRIVRDLPGLLSPGDLLVVNTSRVVPARFLARNLGTGGRAEGLWLRDDGRLTDGRRVWVGLVKARRHREGTVLGLLDRGGAETGFRLEIVGRELDEPGSWRLAAWDEAGSDADAPAVLERVGLPPLPPYIRGARRAAGMVDDEAADLSRYQTVYARAGAATSEPGARGPGAGASVAAPTAGLHFTEGLLGGLAASGVGRAEVVLHVGTGTFKPVEVDDLDDHPMHAEWCSMPAGAAEAIASAGRVIAAGTTSARTIEAYWQERERGAARPEWLETSLLIQPGYRWRRVDGLLTNFHLPRSTLLALVAALVPGGIERVREVYARAVAERYRFFSYGDAMLILP